MRVQAYAHSHNHTTASTSKHKSSVSTKLLEKSNKSGWLAGDTGWYGDTGWSSCRRGLVFLPHSSCRLRILLLVGHDLELVDLLQLGDLEGAVGLAGLHLQVVDLHVHLL